MSRDIKVVPYKRSEYDRGTSKVMVDGVEWGMFTAEFHGIHGPSYHAQDSSGPVHEGKSYNGAPKPHRFRPERPKTVRRDNIFRKDGERKPIVPIAKQLSDEARRLIEAGHLRHPDVRLAEIEESNRKYREKAARREKEEGAAWDAEIRKVIDIATDSGNTVDDWREAIRAAMRWAQAR